MVRRLHRRRKPRLCGWRRFPNGPRGEGRDWRAGRARKGGHGHDGRVSPVERREGVWRRGVSVQAVDAQDNKREELLRAPQGRLVVGDGPWTRPDRRGRVHPRLRPPRGLLELGVRQELLFEEGRLRGQGAQVGRLQRRTPRVAPTSRGLHPRPEPHPQQRFPAGRNVRNDMDDRPSPPEVGGRIEVRGRAVPVQFAQREDMAVSSPIPLPLFAQRAQPLHGRTRHIRHAHRPRHDAAYAHAWHDGRSRRHGGVHLQEARVHSARRLHVAP